MKLFVAAVPPPDAVAHLAAAVEPVHDGVLRWADPVGWHLTLAFYGYVDEAKLEELADRLGRVARRHPGTEARLAGAVGSAVLWIGVDGDTVALRGLARSAAAAGRRTGVGHQEQQRFRPHVTLARSRGTADLRPYVERLASYAGPEWPVDVLTLMCSHPGGPGRGPRYEPLHRLTLTGVRRPRPRPR